MLRYGHTIIRISRLKGHSPNLDGRCACAPGLSEPRPLSAGLGDARHTLPRTVDASRTMLNDFELERQRRIEENKRRMAEMGIAAAAAKLTAVAEPVPAPQVRPRFPSNNVVFALNSRGGPPSPRVGTNAASSRAPRPLRRASFRSSHPHDAIDRLPAPFPTPRRSAFALPPPPIAFPPKPRAFSLTLPRSSVRPSPQRRKRVKSIVPESERRRSTRERVEINYAERYGLDDDDDLAAARRRAPTKRTGAPAKLRAMADGDHARRRFSVGARVYDSELGTTCHWCRQKTVETHVVCTAPNCGRGRLPVAFCGMCLRNRHGEDVDAALASGCWTCPKCRGSCGEGCVTCCNCGPCRKAAGLSPTHQIIGQARQAGFDNVHDYLVHRVVGATPEQLARRKRAFAWGRWLREDFKPAKEAVEKAKTASQEAKTARAEKAKTADEETLEVATPPPSAPRARRSSATPSPGPSNDAASDSAAAASRARVSAKRTTKKKTARREDMRDYFPRASKRARVVA